MIPLGIICIVFGLIVGSFLNVCIYRIPRGISVVAPSSACPTCKKPIRPWDNIPILSFLILGGRCRQCGTRISLRYPLVELANGLLLFGVLPAEESDKVCLECKRREQVCVMVTRSEPCLGPETRTGCGAICPSVGRDCYGCFGPAEALNTHALAQRFAGFGLLPDAIARRFLLIHSHKEPLHNEARLWLAQKEQQ